MRLVLSIFVICNLFTLLLFYYDSFFYFYHHDQNDIFMDFFNVIIHSIHTSYYSILKSVYTPLNFLILDNITQLNKEFFDVPHTDSSILRELFSKEIFFLGTLYVISSIYYFILFSKVELSKKKFLFIICCISSPVIFLIERMNLLLIIFPLFFALLNKDIKNFKFALFLAIIINIKIYFIVLMVFVRIRTIFLTCILSLVIFFLSYIFIDDIFSLPNYLTTLLNFSGTRNIAGSIAHNYSLFSIKSILDTQKHYELFLKFFEAKFFVQFLIIFFQLNIIKFIFFVLLFFLSIKYDYQKRVIIGYLTILITMPEIGGYIGILVLPILVYLIENYKNILHYNILVSLLFLLILPTDFKIYELSNTTDFSFYFGKFVNREINIYLFYIVRPILLLIILYYFLSSFKQMSKSFIK